MRWNNKRVLVTGGAGFIGSHISRRLIKVNAEVVVLDNFSAGKKNKFPEECTIVEADIRDSKALERIGYVDYIFSFGAPSSVILFNREPVACVEMTVSGFLGIVEWAVKIGSKKIIYPTSGSVYGSAPVPQSETAEVLPMNLYGIAKLACEHIARIYSHRMPAVGLRIFAGYGPGEEHKGDFGSPVTLFLDSMRKNQRPVVYGNGTQSRDFVYIDDVVEAVIRAAEKEVQGIVNVGSGKAYSFNEVINCINDLLGKRITPIYVDKPVNYLEKTLADITTMKKRLGIDPLDLKSGLQRYLQSSDRNV
jgi:UDP-glucose 4-epimerase